MGNDEEKFNGHNGRFRVSSEHTIGIWKGRFPWLRNIPMKITEDKHSIKKILKYIDCCVVLHNLFLLWNDESKWMVEEDHEEDPFDDHLSDPITEVHGKDERRQRPLECFREFVF